MSADHLEHEPIPGLPEELPEGEVVVWQGRPDWRALARHGFKLRLLAAYFGVLIVARAVLVVVHDQGTEGLLELGTMTLLFAAGLGLVVLLAWLNARATIYTITTRRVVMRIGVALSAAWNLPFKRLAGADFVERPSGDGDIVLELAPPDRVRWIYFWPHVQPGRVLRARPALRAIRQPARVSALLREAVQRWAAESSAPVSLSDVTDATERAPMAADRPAVAVGQQAVV